ncbi:dipeptide ABC transporter ATP-binding protein [Actinomyces vulturis]|uniref:dipeptide ABC transporter ATP-binding protein n=1 Tax=Actinomyces vulturis TaxID=1857645 RepID=UPI00082F99C0|nr:ABC transporter ATP-binding protein [Actinomyces vulturis]
MTQQEAVARLSGVSVQFAGASQPASSEINLEILASRVLALVGESGSGKSVTALGSIGLLPSTATVTGSAVIGGTEFIGASRKVLDDARGRLVGTIFQEPTTALDPLFTVGFQIAEAAKAHPGSWRADSTREHVISLLTRVGLNDPERIARSYPHQLSGGQLQRACIALALACDPPFLIADEPTTALDVTVQAGILDLLRDITSTEGVGVLLITHDMGVVADVADDVAVMRHGHIVERGSVDDIFYNPQHPYTKQLLASVPRLDAIRGVHESTLPSEREHMSCDSLTGLRAMANDEPNEENVPVEVTSAFPSAEVSQAADGVSVSCTATSVPQFSSKSAEFRDSELSSAHPLSIDSVASSPHDSASETAPVVSVDHLDVVYKTRRRAPFHAVRDVSFEIPSGSVLGLVGESGSGKSTIANTLIGLVPVASGSVIIDGVQVAGAKRRALTPVRKRLGVVYQNPASSLNPRRTVGFSIAEPLVLNSDMGRSQRRARVEELLDAVQLPRDYADRYPHEMSGGQRQRIAIARALALNPRLVIADEPTSALDVSVQAVVLDLLSCLQQELGFACLFVSHDLAVVESIADSIVVLRHGAVVESGSTREVLANPTHQYTRDLVAAVPVPDPMIQAKRRLARDETLI